MDSQYLYGIFFIVIIILISYLYLQHLNLAETVNRLYVQSCTKNNVSTCQDCLQSQCECDEDYDEVDEDSEAEADGEEESDGEEELQSSEMELKVEDILDE